MKTSAKRVIFLMLVCLLAGGGFAAWRVLGNGNPTSSFRTATVLQGELTAAIHATGTVQPEEVIDVGAQVAAQIKNFGADPRDPQRWIDYGSPVHEGTLLAQLDDSLFTARVEQAQAAVDEAQAAVHMADAAIVRAEADLQQFEAKLHQAERDWDRAQQLRLTRAIADMEFDAARAAHESAAANGRVGKAAVLQAKAAKIQAEKTQGRAAATLREAQVNLGYTQIRSPVEGVILDRRVNVGQTVVAGLNAPSLFLIAKDLKKLQVWASVNEADIGQIHPGQPVTFSVDAFPRLLFHGTVAQVRLNASMTQNVVNYTVVVSTDNSDGRLLPYMTASLQFQVDQRSEVVQVPNAALRWKPKAEQVAPTFSEKTTFRQSADLNQERGTVWVQQGAFVRPVEIVIGMSDGVNTEVLEGDLLPGQLVVVGTQRLAVRDAAANPFAPKLFGGKK